MKLNEKMRYPHPVLSEYSSDYITGELKAEFFHQQTDEYQLKIGSYIGIENTELVALIEQQKAASGYFVVCRRTYFNRLQEAPPGSAEKYFDLSLLQGLVTLRPVVWTLQNITGYKSPLIDDEFGDNISLGKGSIVAMGPEFRFSIDSRRFKPFETIFSLSVDDSVPPGMIEVDPDQDKIGVLAETKTHASIADMRNIEFGRSVLLSSVFMPVVVDIIARLQAGDTSLESKRWYQVFIAKCDDLGLQPADSSASPLLMAQQLLTAPLIGTIRAAETIG